MSPWPVACARGLTVLGAAVAWIAGRESALGGVLGVVLTFVGLRFVEAFRD